VTPDLEYSHKLRRANLQTIWRSSLWAEAKAEFLKHHTDMKCERCGVVGNIVPGHTSEDYMDMPSYIPKVKENRVEALCPKCNQKEFKSLKPCKGCITKYQATNGKHWIRYIPQFMESCRDCCDPGEVALKAKERDAFKDFVRKVRDNDNKKRRKFYKEKVKKK
jgi:Zn finger protein HypA/HybF involved in hydrogenase expression